MKSWRILTTLLVPFLFANCRGTLKTKPAAKHDDGRVPTEVRAEDAAQVDAWKAAGNKGGFFPAKEALAAPLTPANSGFVVDLDAQRTYVYLMCDVNNFCFRSHCILIQFHNSFIIFQRLRDIYPH